MRSSSVVFTAPGTASPPEEYIADRERLQRKLASGLRAAMATLVGNIENADLVLVSADGKKIPAHECILRARAPGFYQRHVEATISVMERQRSESGPREVAIGDIDSAGLEFFIHSVYTEDEIAMFPSTTEGAEERRDGGSRNSNRSFTMGDEETDLEEFRSDMEDSSQRDPAPKGDRITPMGQQHMHQLQHAPASAMLQQQSMQMQQLLQQQQEQQESLRAQLSRQQSAPIYAVPSTMTSFRDLASGSPMNSSIYSLGGRSEIGPDIPEEEEDSDRRDSARTEDSVSSFIRLDSVTDTCPSRPTPVVSPTKRQKAIFPMFIGIGDDGDVDRVVPEGIRGRAMMAKRLSVASLTSLTSIDMMTTSEVNLDPPEKHPSCPLAADLLRMYLDNIDTDVVIKTENGDLFAHKCILSAMCPFFRQQLKKSPKLEMKGYSKNTVHFLLSFLYGGVTTIPDEVDVWEIVSLATHLNLKHLVELVILHLKMTRCHYFHRPCSGCVSAAFDILPHLQSIRCLKPLYEEVMQWQARHFSRIWKSRVFLHANEKWHRECFDAVIQYMDDETLIDIILSCERLQTCLPRVRSEASTVVATYVNEILDLALQFLAHSFHLIVTSKSFITQGKGLALNVGLLEELLPPLVHSLSADVAIKTYIGLTEIRDSIRNTPPRQDERGFPVEENSPRFLTLVHRLCDLIDKHLLHFAASVVRADSFVMLPEEEQQRIHDTGLFVEMRQPKATPPRLSSFYRTYKRSASAGVQPLSGQMFDARKRTQSIERSPQSSPHHVRREPAEVPMEEETKAEAPKKSEETAMEVTSVPAAQPVQQVQQPSTSRGVSPRTEKSEKEKRKTDKPEPQQAPPAAKDSPPQPSKMTSPAPPASTSKDKENQKEKEPTSASTTTARDPVTRKTSEGRRSPVKAVRGRAIETEDGGRFERQQTHTIIQPTEAAKAAAAASLPGPSPKKVPEKPKSVVKPMPQESLAKERALPRVGPAAAAAVVAPAAGRAAAAAAKAEPSKIRSSIPRKAATPAAPAAASRSATDTTSRRRQPEAAAGAASRAPRSPKTARKTMAN
ncbi:hypothetical protein PENTCL1PPCAC_25955 [Pristionchus entomophagus]|uniref:BTB domain-containing protein n=1 Tax=Pristionchus entomophagus TaxID=358040 RepID=A0AAV5UA75_9BILA|nr:hypothetical protein PENTCL1PPCAC_25955 [Pristionchus entomophagus]